MIILSAERSDAGDEAQGLTPDENVTREEMKLLVHESDGRWGKGCHYTERQHKDKTA
jgi:hypothetical protein